MPVCTLAQMGTDFQMKRRTNMNHVTHCRPLIHAALLAITVIFCLTPKLGAVEREDNAEVTDLLSQAAQEAAQLSHDADDMESLLHSDVSWQSHADMLNRIRDDVNTL